MLIMLSESWIGKMISQRDSEHEDLGCGGIFQRRNMERGSSWEADGEFSFKILRVEFEECIKYLGGTR